MHFTLLELLLLSSCILPQALAAIYALTDNYVGTDFLTGFIFQNITDPTNGRVTYVTEETALALNLTYASGDTLIMRADDTTILDPDGPGRNSVRIMSVNNYTTHVAVFDIRHMPEGCSTWPAAWETGATNWPDCGEVDIVSPKVEGVNSQPPNAMTLHTSANCSMPTARTMAGTATGNDCDVDTSNNAGCGVQASTDYSFGPSFNAIGGGWYAMERNPDSISVWFWARNATGTVPSDMSSGNDSIDTDAWGTPTAYFPNTQCDIDSHFSANNIIFDLTFCGDWAGIDSVFNAAGCPGDCVDFVNNNASSFADAYWDVAAVRVYT